MNLITIQEITWLPLSVVKNEVLTLLKLLISCIAMPK